MEHLIIVTYQKNAGKDYYYPHNELAFAITTLMQRKALVPKDLEALKALGKALGVKLTLKIHSPEVTL